MFVFGDGRAQVIPTIHYSLEEVFFSVDSDK